MSKKSLKTVKETTSAPAEKLAKTSKPESVMYLGPSIPGVVQYSTVFKNGILTKPLNECVERLPYMKKLLVPLNKLPQAMRELNDEKSALSTLYRKTKKEI